MVEEKKIVYEFRRLICFFFFNFRASIFVLTTNINKFYHISKVFWFSSYCDFFPINFGKTT